MKTLWVSNSAMTGSRYLCAVATTLAIGSAEAQNRVLFIGNSFTLGWSDEMTQMVGGVPAIFDAMAQAGGHADPDTVMRAVAGKNFEYHVADLATQHAINLQQWTHVVLQNRSADPTHLAKGSIEDHHTFGAELYDQVMVNNGATQVILYETFSRAESHPLITGVSSPYSFASTAEFQEEVRINYAVLAESLTVANPGNLPVQVAPVGSSWERAGGLLSPDAEEFVDLHSRDEYHGNDNGYYLAAAVIYATIYEKSPEGLSESAEVQALNLGLTEDAVTLERVAWNSVRSSMLVDFGGDIDTRNATDDEGSVTVTAAPRENNRIGNQFSDIEVKQIEVVPASSGSLFEITAIERGAAGITLTWASTVDAVYTIESSSDLEKWLKRKDGIVSTGRTTACTVTPSADALLSFYRVTGE